MKTQGFRWQHGAAWIFVISLYAAILPACSASAAANAEAVSWLCWVMTGTAPAIRCSLDVVYPAELLTQEETDSSEVLELLHVRFFEGASEPELERLFELGSFGTLANGFLTIPLHNIPYAASWRGERPLLLLRSVLCGKDIRCIVTLHKPND